MENVIESIDFRGARRTPQDMLRAIITTKKGDPYDPEQLNRDFMLLWNSGRFEDMRMEREPGKTGWIITFVITERRVIRSIKYEPLSALRPFGRRARSWPSHFRERPSERMPR